MSKTNRIRIDKESISKRQYTGINRQVMQGKVISNNYIVKQKKENITNTKQYKSMRDLFGRD